MPEQQAGKPHAAVHPSAALMSALRGREFDLLVIGGGITGCAVARDAALRGMSVALVEREDFAAGTSSRSSRLIHGGIRYLEHGHLRLVFEASAERRLLLRLAPHLVRPLEFTWPVYEGARIGRFRLRAGLALYDALAAFRNVRRHRSLGRREVVLREPGLRQEGLRGGAAYFDGCTDDARLTLANALGAREAGAVVANHVEVTSLILEGGRVRGSICSPAGRESPVEVRARVVVNATGPWSDRLRGMEEPSARLLTRGSKGSHVLVPREAVGNSGALTLVSPIDGRVMFVLPQGRFTLIGTTETEGDEPLDEVRATAAEVDYLLKSAASYFPAARLDRDAVINAWAGVRPLAAHAGEHRSASREHSVVVGPSGMITVTGGKLTTYRRMAAEIVDRAIGQLGGRRTQSTTGDTVLPGGAANPARERGAALAVTGEADVASRLVAAYGSGWRDVWTIATSTPSGRDRLCAGLPYIVAEVIHGARHELARTLGDLLIRRVPLAFETRDRGESAVEAVLAALVAEPGWRGIDREALVAGYREEVRRMFEISDPTARPSRGREWS